MTFHMCKIQYVQNSYCSCKQVKFENTDIVVLYKTTVPCLKEILATFKSFIEQSLFFCISHMPNISHAWIISRQFKAHRPTTKR